MSCHVTVRLTAVTLCQAQFRKWWACLLQVVQLPKYRAWMSSFGEGTQHIMVNSQAVPHTFPLTSSATLQVSPHLQNAACCDTAHNSAGMCDTCDCAGLQCTCLTKTCSNRCDAAFATSKLCCQATISSCERMYLQLMMRDTEWCCWSGPASNALSILLCLGNCIAVNIGHVNKSASWCSVIGQAESHQQQDISYPSRQLIRREYCY